MGPVDINQSMNQSRHRSSDSIGSYGWYDANLVLLISWPRKKTNMDRSSTSLHRPSGSMSGSLVFKGFRSSQCARYRGTSGASATRGRPLRGHRQGPRCGSARGLCVESDHDCIDAEFELREGHTNAVVPREESLLGTACLGGPGSRLAGDGPPFLPSLIPASLVSVALLMQLVGPEPAMASSVVNDVVQNPGLNIPGLVGDSPFREGFVSGFLLIFFSEIGDKTFFIALLLALQRPKGVVFTGTFGALAIMTVISVGLGRVLHEIDELFPDVGFPLDDVLAVALLVFFGIQTLASASDADETAEEEKEEAQEVVDDFNEKEYEVLGLVLSTFALVFAAEWGDKSFLATIALAAASDPLGVIGGAVTGHGVATVIAVLGGSFLGKYLSERTVQYVGGSLFLLFAAGTLVDIFRDMQ